MDCFEEISGEKIFPFLRKIEKEKTILRVHFMGHYQFERLTIITGQKKIDDETFFLIDRPEGLANQFREGEKCRLFFEFIDRQKIHYSFKTDLKKINRDIILVHLPEAIRRIQRRRNFRVKAPPGIHLNFKLNDISRQLNVIDLSQNGALVQQTLKEHREHSGEEIIRGLKLKDLELICPGEKDPEPFFIQQAVIRRIQKDIHQGQFFYAMHFIGMDKKQQERLASYIYNCQREELRKRT